MKSLVGYTGFVGSNICKEIKFEGLYNSKNIKEAYGTAPELLIYSGVRAEKFLANREPEKDLEYIIKSEKNIERIKPKQLVLISTIDVFANPLGVDEETEITEDNLQAYGKNRYELEKWVRDNYKTALIVRLPGLFGNNIKKNFIYDYINVIPDMLTETKMTELSVKCNEIKNYYIKENNGFYKIKNLNIAEKDRVKSLLKELEFSALNFTDSRSVFQFYNLARLYDDIMLILKEGLTLCHLATEPIVISELYNFLSGKEFDNELDKKPLFYDYRTKYAELFRKQGHYIENKGNIMTQIKKFVERVGSKI